MSFAAAVDHLHALGQELSPSAPRRKFDLDHMRVLARALGDPQTRFPSVLIAGTNGKGSTAATLASILAASGLRSGLYTSPHLSRVTERIRVAGQPATSNQQPATFAEIPEETFARLYFQVDDAANRLVTAGELPHHPSFFETLTALAFLHFAEAQVDIAVLEVGLGGRLDATNIVEPILSVITDIALDHQDYLGNTIAEIAREKAGILRPNGTLITLPQHPEANQAIGEAAIALNVRALNAAAYLPNRNALEPRTSNLEPGPLHPNHYNLTLNGELLRVRSPLAGSHQQRNIALAIAAAIELRNHIRYTPTSPTIIRNQSSNESPNVLSFRSAAEESASPSNLEPSTSNLEAGIAATTWPGRLEFLPPNLLLDVAHNPAGAWALRAAVSSLPEDQPRTLLFSCLRDKDLTEMARILFPLFDASGPLHLAPGALNLVLTPIDNPRAASLDDLVAAARALDIPAHPARDYAEALALARSLTPPNGLIIATGSIYLIGAIREAALIP